MKNNKHLPGGVITQIEQVTPAWLTSVLASKSVLSGGAVAAFEVTRGRGNWSTNFRLNLRYTPGSQGAMPQRLFLKIVNTHMADETFDSSEVNYYTQDYTGVPDAPLVRCYDAVYSDEYHSYHILLDDLSETYIEASEKLPTLSYGLALAHGLAAMHARWWGARQFTSIGASIPTPDHIYHFVDISKLGVASILEQYITELEPHWPDVIRTLFIRHPQAIIARAQDERGFTLIHGDIGHHNILVPREGDQPLYIIDRQPFAWSLTTWLGAYDLAYAMVLDWEIDTRKRLEIPVLMHYHARLIENGVRDYAWDQLLVDYRLCAAMCVFVAAEYFRSAVDGQWISTWLLMLRRSLTACDDLNCSEFW